MEELCKESEESDIKEQIVDILHEIPDEFKVIN